MRKLANYAQGNWTNRERSFVFSAGVYLLQLIFFFIIIMIIIFSSAFDFAK